MDKSKVENAFAHILCELEPGAAEQPYGELREGLQETPARVAKAWAHWTSGYAIDPLSLLKSFEDGAEGYKELVIVKDIPLYSKCEHHLADIFGHATVAYLPSGRVVGLSKLNRLVDCFARRLQVQERMTRQIVETLMQSDLKPAFAACYIKARHMCMESRGVQQQGQFTITKAFSSFPPNIFNDNLYRELKAEFLRAAEA